MSEATITGYCRACGKALTEGEVQRSHGAYYCKEHVPAEGTPSSPYSAPPPPPNMPPVASGVSPAAAFWLGLIPGVGAIYNGQYAKGFIHVALIALGFSIISNDAAGGFEPLVGMMIAAFWAYMPFEAYHTARKRQLGQPVDEVSSMFPGRISHSVVPAILIVLGTVLLLDNLGLLELRRVMRYWPVLLIAAGVYMLYTRLAGSGASSGGSLGGSAEK